MGGGDLNMKKSWHPSTFQNLERVWKAQQKDENEKKKIAELKQQIAEERAREEMEQMAVDAGLKGKSDKLNWMYQGIRGVDREEYLMGKKIDKAVDTTLQDIEREKEALATGPGALFVPSKSDVTIDLAAKIREDPLFTIRKKEEERKKTIMSNPVKMAQIKQAFEKMEKSKKKTKKSKRSAKRLENEMDSSFKRRYKSGSDSDGSHGNLRHSSSSKHIQSRTRYPNDREDGELVDRYASSRSDRRPREYNHKGGYPTRRERSRSPSRKVSSDRPQSDLPAKRSRHHSPLRHRQSLRSHHTGRGSSDQGATKSSKKMSAEELEQRRKEMMENAAWRETEREKTLKKAHQEEEKEKSDQQNHPSFLQYVCKLYDYILCFS